MTGYLVYDVFTETPFGGNPLAVIPDATGLNEGDLQKIAREFNFSETTFVYPPNDPVHSKRVRIFTPSQEVPFAGHPTIGTAIALNELGMGNDLILELGVGPIPCRVDDGRAEFRTEVPLETWDGPSVDLVATCIGLDPSAVRTDRHPPVIASVGLAFAIAELSDRDALSAARMHEAPFHDFQPHWPTSTVFDLLVYVRDGNQIESRVFAPLDGVPEDPATGSANAALAAYLAHLDSTVVNLNVSQGVDMGRPSVISASADETAVTIGGAARKVMEGRLTL